MKINYVSLNKQSKDQSQKLIKIFRKCLDKSIFVNGDEVSKFEKKSQENAELSMQSHLIVELMH